MKPFEPGEEVLALTDSLLHPGSQPRKKGQLYQVLAVHFCSNCGRQQINIQGKIPKPEPGYSWKPFVPCHGCKMTIPTNGLYWTDSCYFARPSDLPELEKLAVKEERFEDAQFYLQLQIVEKW